jgi:hypothetical protein
VGVELMDVVSFMDIEETEKDLIISFALDVGDGCIKTLLLHRTLFYEFALPDEERGTKVSLEGHDLPAPHINTLELIIFDANVLRIKARFSDYKIDLRKVELEEIEKIKQSLVLHNYDDRFEVKYT